ncbi:MAG: HK97-gp10 family putative phage morphogenesis protein [Acidobacteriota bacterium]
MSVQIRKTGFNFAALSARMRRNIAEELNSGAESCVSLGQQLAPVSVAGSNGNPRGYMRDHIKQTDEATASHLRAEIVSEADYSAFVEYGTVNSESQPFFTPSFESARRQVNNGLLRALK